MVGEAQLKMPDPGEISCILSCKKIKIGLTEIPI